MVPAISFAYENPELDIMERKPRHAKRDHLVNTKLISFSYLQIGIIQASAGFYTYFYILNDYGFKPATLFSLAKTYGWEPEFEDIYDPTAPNYGNSRAGMDEYRYKLNWDGTRDKHIDARLFYTERGAHSWNVCRWDPNPDADGSYSVPSFWVKSWISDT